MNGVVFIPARYNSSRFPGKPLARIMGAERELTLIHRTWQAAVHDDHGFDVFVLTDDPRIADEVEGFGGTPILTPSICLNGTERCAAALDKVNFQFDRYDIVVNWQGDSPVFPGGVVKALVKEMAQFEAEVGTVAARGFAFKDPKPGVSVVMDRRQRALYFSRSPIPYQAEVTSEHFGLYAYTPGALSKYASHAPSDLENTEQLEQLRFIENGIPIHVHRMTPPSYKVREVNEPDDVRRVSAILKQRGIP